MPRSPSPPRALRVALAGSIAALGPITAAAPSLAQGLVTIESRRSVTATVDALIQNLTSRGANIAARINHAQSAKAFGLEMAPAEVVVFGNPKLGTPLMQANPAIALDLPLRIAVWQAADGKVLVGYRAPAEIAAGHAITGQDEVLATMAGVLDSLARKAAGVAE